MSNLHNIKLPIQTLLFDMFDENKNSNIKNYKFFENNYLNILIIGNSDELLKETIKTVFWCCKLPNVSLNITVAYKKADSILQEVFSDTIIETYGKDNNICFNLVRFSGNADSLFEEITGDFDFSIIAIEDKEYSKKIKETIQNKSNKSYKSVFNIIDYYSESYDLVTTAYNINFCYELTYKEKETNYENLKKQLDIESYNFSSSLAQATHYPYKKYYENYLKCSNDSKDIITDKLAKFEHERWNLYQVSEGYKPLSLEALKVTKNRKDTKKKMHACICDFGEPGRELENNPVSWETYNTEEKIIVSNLSELDKVSLFCNIYDSDIKEKKVDLKAYDYQLVNMIDFCQWYKKKYSTLVVVCSENCFRDMIIPTIIIPEKIVLIKSKDTTKNVEDMVSKYLKGRSIDAKVYSYSLDYSVAKYLDQTAEIDFIFNQIKTNICKDQKIQDDLIICMSDEVKPNTAALFATYSYINNIPCLTYIDDKIVPFCKEVGLNLNMSRFSVVVDEFFPLNNWLCKNDSHNDNPVLSYEECMALAEVFFKYATANKHTYKLDNKDKSYTSIYTLWEKLSSCYIKQAENIGPDELISFDCKFRYDNMQDKNGDLIDLAEELFSVLESCGIIRDLQITDPSVSFKVNNVEKYKTIGTKSGELFEKYIFHKLDKSGLFTKKSVSCGVEITYNNNVEEIENNSMHHNDNEIDVVAFKGFIPILISCKSIADYSENAAGNKAIYEISSEAKQFHGIPVLAVSRTLGGSNKESIDAGAKHLIKRAKAFGVHLLDANILCNENYFKDALLRIIEGKTIVSPNDY